MDIVKVYANSFKESIKNVIEKDYKSDNEKYLDVGIHYANIMTCLSKNYPKFTLTDLLPITNIFHDYQENYFND